MFFNSLTVTGDYGVKSVQTVGKTNAVIAVGTSLNATYNLEERTNLVSGSWSTIISNVPGTGGVVLLTNTVPANVSQNFYRVKVTVGP